MPITIIAVGNGGYNLPPTLRMPSFSRMPNLSFVIQITKNLPTMPRKLMQVFILMKYAKQSLI